MASAGDQPLVTGSFVSDGAAVTVPCGFRPKKVELLNLSNAARGYWVDTMPDDSVVVAEGGTESYATSDGITPGDASFDVGTNAVINTSGEEVHWVAYA